MNKHSRATYDENVDVNDCYNQQFDQGDFEYSDANSHQKNSSKRHRGINNYLIRKKNESRHMAKKMREFDDDKYEQWN